MKRSQALLGAFVAALAAAHVGGCSGNSKDGAGGAGSGATGGAGKGSAGKASAGKSSGGKGGSGGSTNGTGGTGNTGTGTGGTGVDVCTSFSEPIADGQPCTQALSGRFCESDTGPCVCESDVNDPKSGKYFWSCFSDGQTHGSGGTSTGSGGAGGTGGRAGEPNGASGDTNGGAAGEPGTLGGAGR